MDWRSAGTTARVIVSKYLFKFQIDGSTLKTLCVQHGPLQNFHLYLNQGIALARYSTREEAAKVSTITKSYALK